MATAMEPEPLRGVEDFTRLAKQVERLAGQVVELESEREASRTAEVVLGETPEEALPAALVTQLRDKRRELLVHQQHERLNEAERELHQARYRLEQVVAVFTTEAELRRVSLTPGALALMPRLSGAPGAELGKLATLAVERGDVALASALDATCRARGDLGAGDRDLVYHELKQLRVPALEAIEGPASAARAAVARGLAGVARLRGGPNAAVMAMFWARRAG